MSGPLKNQKHEEFCQAVCSGISQSDAYRVVYNVQGWENESVWRKSSALATRDEVRARIHELQEELAAKMLWTREEAVKELRALIPERGNVAVAAVKELNAMHGFNAPLKVEHTIVDISRVTLEQFAEARRELLNEY